MKIIGESVSIKNKVSQIALNVECNTWSESGLEEYSKVMVQALGYDDKFTTRFSHNLFALRWEHKKIQAGV